LGASSWSVFWRIAVPAASRGLAVGAVLPHDLEGVLVIIGVVGVQLSLSQNAWVNVLLPLDGPIQLAYRAGGQSAAPIGPMLLHAAISTVALLTLAAVVWARKVRVIRPRQSPPGAAAGGRARRAPTIRMPIPSWRPEPVPVRSDYAMPVRGRALRRP